MNNLAAMKLRTFLLLLLSAPLLSSCDMLYDVLDIPDPATRAAKAEAEGRAIGGGCRHSGRSLEDCYVLNPQVSKAAVFAGWRDMNDYMTENKLPEVPPRLAQPGQPVTPPTASSPGTFSGAPTAPLPITGQ